MIFKGKNKIIINIKSIIILLCWSIILTQECGDSICEESETYINCIDDCYQSIPSNDILVWIDDVPVHIDSQYVDIPLNVLNLENIISIQFEIEYDSNILELDISECGDGTGNSHCSINNNLNVSYLTNTVNAGIIMGIIYTAIPFNLETEIINIKFSILGELGDSSNININYFIIETLDNQIDITQYSDDGKIMIGNFGCMDELACNYSDDATFDDGSCKYELDCFGICGGSTIVDCFGICGGSGFLDISDTCCDISSLDECSICNGSGIAENTCDCEGTEPFIYCIDNDGDGSGSPSSSFSSCNEYNDSSLVTNCEDQDDNCNGSLDDCNICNGENLDKDCNGICFGLSEYDCFQVCDGSGSLDSEGLCCDISNFDECDVCNGDGISEGSCDCNGTQPISYCMDLDLDGASDSNPLLFCDPPSGVLVECETLDVNKIRLEDYKLFSAYPNPFNPYINIEYIVDVNSPVHIDVINLKGVVIENLFSEIQTKGMHSILWEPKYNTPSGIYILRLKHNKQILAKKINYIK